MSITREDAFAIGARLKAQEAADSRSRIEAAIKRGGAYAISNFEFGPTGRAVLAEMLYVAAYTGEPTDREVLDSFCWTMFGCTFEEALKAWDEELG